MEISTTFFKKWEQVYYSLHYFSYELFLKNLCNDEYNNIYTESEGNEILKRFQQYQKNKLKDVSFVEGVDEMVFAVARLKINLYV